MTKEFSQPGRAAVIIDGQYGSTGKGGVAAYLSQFNEFDIATTNASANAGHTTVIGDRKFVTFHLPTMAVMQDNCLAYLNAGAIIDPDVLMQELEEHGWHDDKLIIHPFAAVILPEHKEAERKQGSGAEGVGSTQKGVGMALASKLLRRGNVASEHPLLKKFCKPWPGLNGWMDEEDKRVVVEVPQGFSLGLNHGHYYPFCTSRDVTVSQALADANIHPSFLGKVMMTVRSYPIRVGNIVDEHGQVLGYSGPPYPGQEETSWEAIGQTPELTTVTKRVRRVFKWSDMQWVDAVSSIRPDYVFYNFVNYHKTAEEFRAIFDLAQETYSCPESVGCEPFTHYGLGPDIADIVEGSMDVVDAMRERGLWTR